jgi:carbon storage regulator
VCWCLVGGIRLFEITVFELHAPSWAPTDNHTNTWPGFLVKYNKANRQKELTMLVLSRQKDESIVIGDDVEVTIVDVRGDKVRLGITAPKNIPVHRREIYEAIQREKNRERQAQEKTQTEPEQKTPQDLQEQPKQEPQKQQ